MATEVAEAATNTNEVAVSDEVKPYKIHVSSRYLDLTKQKLEITRLPHEVSEPRSEDWWEPKPQVEPLIDFWLEQYDWRKEEEAFNTKLLQFRTPFTVPNHEAPIRLHFVHVASTHSNAVPLLLIPPFPVTNLSLGHMITAFTDPPEGAGGQSFHLVIPSLPGLGFSDALPNNSSVIPTTADILNSLMKRLSYEHYLVSNSGSGSASPAEIDWKLANYLVSEYADTCLGAHFISPILAQPKIQEAPVEWAKWSIARFFQAPILGYQSEDFSALERQRPPKTSRKSPPTPAQFGLNQLGLREPNTLAYALCDSPTGLLVFALQSLRLLEPKKVFTPTEIINFTQLAWLPGPEAAMRFWAYCVRHPESSSVKRPAKRPRVAITVFLGDEPAEEEEEAIQGEGEGDVEAHRPAPPKKTGLEGYVCPSWAKSHYQVVHAHRAAGKAGMLAWERPEIIVDGIRKLAQEVLKHDSRLRPEEASATAPLESVVVPADGESPGSGAGTGTELQTMPTPTIVTPTPATTAAPTLASIQAASAAEIFSPVPSPQPITRKDDGLLAPIPEERIHPTREISDETRVASDGESPGLLKEPIGSDSTLVVASSDTLAADGPPPMQVA